MDLGNNEATSEAPPKSRLCKILSWRGLLIILFVVVSLVTLKWLHHNQPFGDPQNLRIYLLEKRIIDPPASQLSPQQPAALRSGYVRCNHSGGALGGRPRVAVCISGLTRSFASVPVQTSLQSHFMRDHYDVYLSLSDHFNSSALQIPIACQWTGSIPARQPFQPQPCPVGSFNHRRSFRMAYRWLGCMQMIQKHERSNPSLSYSHVLFTRSDVMYTSRVADLAQLYERHRAGSDVVSWDDQSALTSRRHAEAIGMGASLAYSSCADAAQWAHACDVTLKFARWNVETHRVPCCPLRLVSVFEGVSFHDCGFLYTKEGAQCMSIEHPRHIHLYPRHMATWREPGDTL